MSVEIETELTRNAATAGADGAEDGAAIAPTWRILVVDNDPDVLEATEFALRHTTILGRSLEVVYARSEEEALAAMVRYADVAVAFIDVVMETPDAGLELVRKLRELGYDELRIVLRTGYPGYAPELSVITHYEIDDYRTKDELTRVRLISVLTAAIRAYDQLRTLSRSRQGLQMVIDSSTQLFKRTNMEVFSQGVLAQVGALMRTHSSGFVCVEGRKTTNQVIVSAMGDFAPLIGKEIDALPAEIRSLIAAARQQSEPLFRDGYMVLLFTSESGSKLCAVLQARAGREDADLDLLRVFCTNISIAFENLALTEEMNRLALTDPIVGIPNASAFEAGLAREIASDRAGKRVAMITLSGFPSTIATYGAQMANRLLREVYGRISELMGAVTVTLIGRGTFGVIAHRETLVPDVVTRTFATPYLIDEIEFTPTATTAIVELSDLPEDPVDALRMATTALVHVRQSRPNEVVICGPEMQREMERKQALQIALKQALNSKTGLEVYLQPIVELTSGRVVAAEALSRWRFDGELVSPDEFIPIAEAAGLTRALTGLVLEQIVAWRESGGDGFDAIPVAVNLSMADLNRPGFAAWTLQEIAELGLKPDDIRFEVTEGVAMEDAARAAEEIETLHSAGYRIAMDDFGTGYSSLKQFSLLPIDILKIDRSFVDTLEVHSARRSLAAIILTMTEALGVDCVAEGIETEEQREALLSLGCTIGQGFLLGRPTPIDQFNATFGRQVSI